VTSAALSAAEGRLETTQPRRLSWRRAPLSAVVTILLALNPVTAILVLGWLVCLMRRETAIAVAGILEGLGRRDAIRRLGATAEFAPLAAWTGWLAASTRRTSWTGRHFGGLVETVRAGIAAGVAILLATLPFTALLLAGWSAGWENSFNKGYEQAWVGPALSLAGIVLALFVLSHLPMALAHFAAERRLSAIFELSTIRALMREQRWRNLWLALLAVVAALPIAAAQILPVFIENWWPGFADMPAEVIEATARRWHVAPTIYLVIVLIYLRRAQARCYARAALALPPDRTPFCHAVAHALGREASRAPKARAKRGWAGAAISGVLLVAVWFGLIAQLYVAQFANHAWWNWINHPIIGLPWVFRPLGS